MRMFRRSVLGPLGLAGVLVVAGCACSVPDRVRAAGGPPAEPVLPGPPVGDPSGLVLRQEVRPASLAPGDTLHVVFTVTNPTGAEIRRTFTSGCVVGMALWDDAGRIAAPPPPICTMDVPTIVYPAGHAERHDWTWVWDGAEPAPGAYRVFSGLGPRGTVAATDPVAVRLVAP